MTTKDILRELSETLPPDATLADATSVNQDELPSAVEQLGLLGANWR
ncbi:MAG TPA: hypothetical protein PK640_06500 [Verrucomicrobiota bacterium]|nr:hypothetical protein [Verrucomicrobiota bacterium]